MYFINVEFPKITAKNNIYSNFDHEFTESLYVNKNEYGIPLIYDDAYRYIKTIPKNIKIITMSPDPAISSSTISSMSEKYIKIHEEHGYAKYTSSVKVIYITSVPHILKNYSDVNIKNLSNSVISNLTCTTDKYTNHEMVLAPTQFILVGLNDQYLSDHEQHELNAQGTLYFTLSQIRTKKIKNVLSHINSIVEECPVHVVFDMSVMSYKYAPQVSRFNESVDGFTVGEIEEIFTMLSTNNITSVDITNYVFDIQNELAHRITCEIARFPLKYLLKIKEKKINIIDETTKILIWRPMEQSSEEDFGWYLMRNVPLDVRENVLAHLGDRIISYNIDDDDVFITSTSIHEQELMTYYACSSIHDCVLYPEERIDMLFELLNV